MTIEQVTPATPASTNGRGGDLFVAILNSIIHAVNSHDDGIVADPDALAADDAFVDAYSDPLTVLHVSPTGDDSSSGRTPGRAKATIAGAVAAGALVVKLAPGDYTADDTQVEVPAGFLLDGPGQHICTITYQGTGFLLNAESDDPTDVTDSLRGLTVRGVTIRGHETADGTGSDTADGALRYWGAYKLRLSDVYIYNFTKADAIAVEVRSAFNLQADSNFHINYIPNGVGVAISGDSDDEQVTNVRLSDFLIQRCAVGFQVGGAIAGGGLHLHDGALNLPADGVGVQFTGKYSDIEFGPGLHIECLEPVATNTSVGFQAVADSGLFIDTVKFRGVDFYNVKTLFDLDASTGHFGNVTFDHLYASALSSLAGTGFKLNTLTGEVVLGTFNIPSTHYTTMFDLTSTDISYPIHRRATASLPSVAAANLGRVVALTDGGTFDTTRDLLRVSSGASGEWLRFVHATAAGTLKVPGTTLQWTGDQKIIIDDDADPNSVHAANVGSIYIYLTNGDWWVKSSGGNGNTGWQIAVDGNKTRSTTQLTDDTHAINTRGKVEGRMIFNATTNKPVWATGSGATDPWVDATGTTAHTPS